MHKKYVSAEAEIYKAAQGILDSESSNLAIAKDALIQAVGKLDLEFRDINGQVIRDLGAEISKLPENA
jgi:hypothetical protein